MRYRRALACLLSLAACLSSAAGLAYAVGIDDAKRDIAACRYGKAEAALLEIVRTARGEEKQEALYLLAGLKRSASEAEMIYAEAIRLDPSGRWGVAAQIELAKVRYAMGEYRAAYDALETSGACRKSDEACLFAGLSAVMLKRYDEAKSLLSRVRGERQRSWAEIAIADAETGAGNRDEACRRYRALARSSRAPTALYRHGECLEERGEIEAAKGIFQQVAADFHDTPEGLLATEKLSALAGRKASESPREETRPVSGSEETTLATGYTIQFGSFADRANAIKLAAELKRDLPGIRIDSDLVKFKEVHRVRYGYFKNRAEAQRRAEEIARLTGEPCTVMPLP